MRTTIVIVLGLLVAAVAGTGPASAAQPAWNGDWSLKRFAATKSGTSLAATQHEPDFSDVYRFQTVCVGETCTATVISGPAPANATLPQPARYTFDGTSWVHVYDWQWDCYMGPGKPKVYAPAHSVAYYTPQPGGTFAGSWRTDIASGPCAGSVVMRVEAYPVATPRVSPFGS
ncbi:Rv2253 family sensor-like surface protein [Williamsia deligens]|uniref:Secreted protein n=1 Tax=Williamsia deligens TaxID=321325 RepID=A0ABW3G8G7_9NOCA|nr:hypothetical protein [Williamsia deligens]MCP2194066.1 hypothetical protein [Williamsia deligens]